MLEQSYKRAQNHAKLLSLLASKLAQAGAETRLIIQSIKQVEHGLGIKGAELGFTKVGIMIKIPHEKGDVIEFKEIQRFGINMSIVTALHQISLDVEHGLYTKEEEVLKLIESVKPFSYNMYLLIFIEAIAAACFSYLNGGNYNVAISAFCGGLVLMATRFFFVKAMFFENFAFIVAAFTGCMTSFIVSYFIVGASMEEVSLSIMATTLILVPGFPFVNGFLDIFKGYVEIGQIRLLYSLVLTASAAIGLLGALSIMRVWL